MSLIIISFGHFPPLNVEQVISFSMTSKVFPSTCKHNDVLIFFIAHYKSTQKKREGEAMLTGFNSDSDSDGQIAKLIKQNRK